MLSNLDFLELPVTNQKAYLVCSEAPSTYVAEDHLVWPQWERMGLILQKLHEPGWEDTLGRPHLLREVERAYRERICEGMAER